jgi:hypothetical protein
MQANLHNSRINGDYFNVDMVMIENFHRDFFEIVKRKNFPINLVFNVADLLEVGFQSGEKSLGIQSQCRSANLLVEWQYFWNLKLCLVNHSAVCCALQGCRKADLLILHHITCRMWLM